MSEQAGQSGDLVVTPIVKTGSRKSKRTPGGMPVPIQRSTPRATESLQTKNGSSNGSAGTSDAASEEEIAVLNNRFAEIISRNAQMQMEVTNLRNDRSYNDDLKDKEVKKIKAMYETELSEARRLLDKEAERNVKLQLDLQNGNAARDVALEKAQTLKVSEAEARKVAEELQGDLDKMNAEVSNLRRKTVDSDNQMATLQMQLSAANEEATKVKDRLDAETMTRIQRDNEIQSCQEGHQMQERILRKQLETAQAAASDQLQQSMANQVSASESQLTATLEDIRSEHEENLATERNKIKAYYEKKLKDLSSKIERGQSMLKDARDEASGQRALNIQTGKELSKAEQDLARIRSALREAEANLASSKGLADARLAELSSELKELREMNAKLNSDMSIGKSRYAELMREVQTYRSLLETEETRLNITPSPGRSRSRERRGKRGRSTIASNTENESPPKKAKTSGGGESQEPETLGSDENVTVDHDKSCLIM